MLFIMLAQHLDGLLNLQLLVLIIGCICFMEYNADTSSVFECRFTSGTLNSQQIVNISHIVARCPWFTEIWNLYWRNSANGPL